MTKFGVLPAPLRGALLGAAAMGIFACYDLAIKFLGTAYHPFQIMFFTGLAAVPFIILQLVWAREVGDYRPKLPRLTAARCAVALLQGGLGTYVFTALPIAQAYAVFFTMPLMIALLGAWTLNEPIRPASLIAILVGFAGVLVALNPFAAGAPPLEIAHLLAVGAAIAGALNFVIMRKTAPIERAAVLIIYPTLSQLAVVALALPFVYQPMPIAHHMLTWVMAVFGIGGTYVIVAAYAAAPAAVVAPMQYTQIIWASIGSYLIFGEVVTPVMALGIAVIIASGVYLLVTTKDDHAADKR